MDVFSNYYVVMGQPNWKDDVNDGTKSMVKCQIIPLFYFTYFLGKGKEILEPPS